MSYKLNKWANGSPIRLNTDIDCYISGIIFSEKINEELIEIYYKPSVVELDLFENETKTSFKRFKKY